MSQSGSKYTARDRDSRNKKLTAGSFNNALTLNNMTGLDNYGLNKTSSVMNGEMNSRNQALIMSGGGEF